MIVIVHFILYLSPCLALPPSLTHSLTLSLSLPHPSLPPSLSSLLSLDSITGITEQMIGYKLKTKQTTGDGVTVKKIMVAESLDIARETYFAIVMDRTHQGPVMVGSPAGGMDIEEVAATSPEKICKVI